MPVIVSVNIALPGPVVLEGAATMVSGILKQPVAEPVYLDSLGFAGDGVADRRHHGGPNKAACAYLLDHYPWWEKELARKLRPGAFGENLTLSGLDEGAVHIGDVFRAGEAEVQVSQPRQPCYKLNKVFNLPDMAGRVQRSGYTGFYFRVLRPGRLEPGGELTLLRTDDWRISVAAANGVMYEDKKNVDKIRGLLALDALSDEWKETFRARLQKLEAVR